MPWNFILPALVSMVSGGIQAGSAGSQAERQNQMLAHGAAQRRQQFRDLIRQIRNTDYGHLDRQASADFSAASDQIDALTAGRGTFRSGTAGARNLQSQALSGAITGLAEAKTNDRFNRDMAVGQILSDPSFGTPDPAMFNPGQAGLQAGLGGAFAGLGSTLAAFLSTEAGAKWLTEAFQGQGEPQQIPVPNVQAFVAPTATPAQAPGPHQLPNFPGTSGAARVQPPTPQPMGVNGAPAVFLPYIARMLGGGGDMWGRRPAVGRN